MQAPKLESMLFGVTGVSASELTSIVEIPSSTDVSEIIKIIVQIAIGIVTILGIFKKKSGDVSQTNKL